MTTIWDNLEKSGTITGGWIYNQPGFSYNQAIDPLTGNTVYYNGVGLGQTWINQAPKSTTNYSNPSKTSSTWTNQVKI